MKAISLWQPWASALFASRLGDPKIPLKLHETRHWEAPSWIIGKRIAIHAAKRWTRDECEFFDGLADDQKAAFASIGIARSSDLPFGAIIGTAVLTSCHPTESLLHIDDDDLFFGNFSEGRFAWRMRDGQLLPAPVPCVGRQGFFDIPEINL